MGKGRNKIKHAFDCVKIVLKCQNWEETLMKCFTFVNTSIKYREIFKCFNSSFSDLPNKVHY